MPQKAFEKISSIDIHSPTSWQNKTFLTIDIDWACDDVLAHTLDILEDKQIPTTLFITHQTPLIQRMLDTPIFELGIHPNFNNLLANDTKYGKTSNEVIQHYLKIVPTAQCVRSHSMTQNSRILEEFTNNNLKFDCNTFIPHTSGIELAPWQHWNNKLTKVPYFWEDDIHAISKHPWQTTPFTASKGLKVFDFHPIHIFLNTENLTRYEKSRAYHHNVNQLKSHINTTSPGTKDFLLELIK